MSINTKLNPNQQLVQLELFEQEDTSGFYTNTFFRAKNSVLTEEYTLKRELKDTYAYPVDGWFWFDSLEEAKQFFKENPKSWELKPKTLKERKQAQQQVKKAG